MNEEDIRPYLKNFLEIQKLVEEYLNFNMITNLDHYKKAKLIALCNASKGEININTFIKKVNQVDYSIPPAYKSGLTAGYP